MSVVSSGKSNFREPFHEQFYYAALFVSCRVCGAAERELCRRLDGTEFVEFTPHHRWRYRDVRRELGCEIHHERGSFVSREDWLAKREEEKVIASHNAA